MFAVRVALEVEAEGACRHPGVIAGDVGEGRAPEGPLVGLVLGQERLVAVEGLGIPALLPEGVSLGDGVVARGEHSQRDGCHRHADCGDHDIGGIAPR